mgnify:FL=1
MSVRVCIPRHLNIGRGALNGIADMLKRMGPIQNPLIVTDRFMVDSGVADRVQHLLCDANISSSVFSEVMPDPTDNLVLKGISVLEAGRHDAVIGLGGGSPIDAGKCIAMMAAGSRDIQDYRPPIISDVAGWPMLAIPTTAGTGSEVTHHTVIIHDETREKISCRGEGFVPTAAIIDFELTLSKPRRLIADNALDTLTHAIEAYVSRKATLFSDRLALDSMRLVGKNLERAYKDPENLEARESLMLAATFGGLAFSNASIALVHAMSRPLGSLFHIPHGMSNAMLLPAVTNFSKCSALGRYADCARVIGFAAPNSDDANAANALVKGLYYYNEHLEVPSLSEFGINQTEYLTAVSQMAEDAVRSGAPANNPRIPDTQEITDLFEEAWA